jgi:outer membrane scaffolding protein for murein synthesis (MipA/OmpV family)
MRNLVVAVGVSGLLAGAIAAPALGAAGHPSAPAAAKVFTSTATPNTHVGPGTVIHVTSNGAMKNTNYFCVMIVLHGGNYGANINTLKSVKSNNRGHVACSQTFKPYTVTDQKNKTRHCPTTAADKAAGFSCAVSLADQSTSGQTSASVAKFTAHK